MLIYNGLPKLAHLYSSKIQTEPVLNMLLIHMSGVEATFIIAEMKKKDGGCSSFAEMENDYQIRRQ